MNAAQIAAIQTVADGNHDWRTQGACVDHDPDIFFDHAEQDPGIAALAKDVCESCPFRERCLDAAMLADEPYGIWGGMDAEERRNYRPLWDESHGGRGAVRTMRNQIGILAYDPSIERRYIARLRAAQECRKRLLMASWFHRRNDYLSVLELIIAHPREDAGTLGRRLGFSKAWFNTMKRDAYAMFNIEETYDDEEQIA